MPPAFERVGQRGRAVVAQNLGRVVTSWEGHGLDLAGASGDEHLTWLANHDHHSAGSDGIYQGQHPHPRGWAAFARLAEQYVASNPETGYQHLARHCATNPAEAFGLQTRGRLADNMTADICIIGQNGLADHAIYGGPTMQATGADLIFVNGIPIRRNGHSESTAVPGELIT